MDILPPTSEGLKRREQAARLVAEDPDTRDAGPVIQQWVQDLTFMQQSVLLSAVRGPDGVAKRHPCKALVRWYRRCIMLSAFDRRALKDPGERGGGSFTGPSIGSEPCDPAYGPGLAVGATNRLHRWRQEMRPVVDAFVDARDELPMHYTVHFMHAAEILGYKHPDATIRAFWHGVYERLVHALHVWSETKEQMDRRLGDSEKAWRERCDPSTACSD